MNNCNKHIDFVALRQYLTDRIKNYKDMPSHEFKHRRVELIEVWVRIKSGEFNVKQQEKENAGD